MTETPVSPATPARSTTQRLGWILLLCVPAGLVIYFGWTQWYSLKHQVKTLQQEAASAAREQRGQNELWQTRLDGLTQEILQLKAADRTDWLLAETEYLLRLANQHAILGHDAPAAAALLAQADKVLLELTSPTEIQTMASLRKIIAIRQQIAEEREALLLRGDIDREGLYLQIEALIQQLDKIPVIDLESMSQNAAAAVMEEEKLFIPDSLGDRLMKSLRQALEKIGGYVRIQHHEQALNTLLSPSEQLYLKQNLRFMLEQAQISVLQHQQTIYTNSLSKAKHWVVEYYVIDSALKKKLLAEIDTLAGYNVEEPLPDIHGSLTSLKALMKLRHRHSQGE